jgi:hypothetical protein
VLLLGYDTGIVGKAGRKTFVVIAGKLPGIC